MKRIKEAGVGRESSEIFELSSMLLYKADIYSQNKYYKEGRWQKGADIHMIT